MSRNLRLTGEADVSTPLLRWSAFPKWRVCLATAIMISFQSVPAVAQIQGDDIEALLKEAMTTTSPLDRKWLCDKADNLLTERKNAENGTITVEVERTCSYFAADGQRIVAVEGRLRNLDTDQALDMSNVAALLQLSLDGSRRLPLPEMGSLGDPKSAAPLPPRDVRQFSLAFAVPLDAGGSLSLEHPAQTGAISIALGEPTTSSSVTTAEETADDTSPPSAEAPGSLPATEGGTIDLDLQLDPVPQAEVLPPSDEDSISEAARDPRQQLSLLPSFDRSTAGALVSRSTDGASLHATKGQIEGDPAAMLNGLTDVADASIVFRPDADGVMESVISLPDGKVTELSYVVVDARSPAAYAAVPNSIQIAVSESGPQGPWSDLGAMPLPDNDKRQLAFALPPGTQGNAIRIAMSAVTGWINLTEFEIYEVAAPVGGSILAGRQADLALAGNGGRVVRFSSQQRDWEAMNMLTPNGAWFPSDGSLPQDLVFAFEHFNQADISEVSIDWGLGEDEGWAPRIKVLASNDPGPLGNYVELGLMKAERTGREEGRTELKLATPTPVRWLKITLSDPGTARFAFRQLHVLGSLLAVRSFEPDTSEPDELAVGTGEPEPNDTLAQAVDLPRGEILAGQSGADGDVDFYRFEVPGPEQQVVSLSLTGRPWIRTSLELFDSSGERLFVHNPLTAETEHSFTWLLAPGRYALKLLEPPSGVAMVIDDSPSMGDAIIRAKEAARLFAMSKKPEESLSLIRFRREVHLISPLTSDGSRLAQLVEIGIDQSGNGGTAMYDAVVAATDTLSETQGNRAIILLTDGEDSQSELTYSEFWAALEKRRVPIYAIGLGEAVRRIDRNASTRLDNMLEAFALGTGGAYFDSLSAEDLPGVWQKIATRLRSRGGYTLKWDIPENGALAVLETGEEFVAADAMGDILFVLDASGSMRAKTDQGRQRIDVARSIMYDMLEDIPDTARVGLRVYGALRPPEPASLSCQDSELMIPLGSGTQKEAARTISEVSPRGQTPIGRSLAQVISDMAGAERGVVVLLTDGEESCDTDQNSPFNTERVGRDLLAAGIDVRVNIVGFDVTDPEAQMRLAKVAAASGGNFFPAEGEAGLRAAMREAFTAPVLVLDDLGQVVAKTKVGHDAISLPAARYHLTIGARDDISPPQYVREAQELRVFVNKEGSEIRISSESVEPGTQMPKDARVNLRPAINDEQQVRLDNLLVQELNTRVPFTPEELTYKVQALLSDLGYEPGPADGRMGPSTRKAVSEFVADFGLVHGTEAYNTDGTPNQFLYLAVFSVHTRGLLRPILFGDEVPPEIAASLPTN